MLVFDIFKKVLARGNRKKSSMGNPQLGFSTDTTPSSLAVGVASTLADIGTSYAIGKGMYKDRAAGTSSNQGIESTMVESGISVVGGNVAATLVGHGMVSLLGVTNPVEQQNTLERRWWLEGLASLPCFYHGYKRHNNSFMWGLGWGMFGDLGLAAAQNFGKPLPVEGRRNPSEMLGGDDGDMLELDEEIIELENPRRKRKMSKKRHRRIKR